MIHIVFNTADVKVLQQAIDLDETLQGSIVEIKDDYAVGPIENLYNEVGIETRKEWWRQVLTGGDYEGKADSNEVNDHAVVNHLVEKLQEDESEEVWIWAAQNKHDVCGYYWLLPFMKAFQGRVHILYLNNLPFINEKGNIFYPNHLHEIQAKEFLKAKKLARPITLSEFEVDPDEWQKLCNESKGVRLLEGGKKLVQQDCDYYDSELKKFILPEWQKCAKVIHNFQHKAKHSTGDAYLLWRIKTLISQELLEAQGKLTAMKDFEIKTK